MPRPGTEEEKDARRTIHETIQATNDTDEHLDGSVLVSWVAVMEWSDGEGERWISRISGSAGGENSPPIWQEDGLLHHALFSWNLEDEDED